MKLTREAVEYIMYMVTQKREETIKGMDIVNDTLPDLRIRATLEGYPTGSYVLYSFGKKGLRVADDVGRDDWVATKKVHRDVNTVASKAIKIVINKEV